MTERVYIFKAFERFWHWSQALLVIFLMVTGFEIHGTYQLLGFERAVGLHTVAAWTLVGLWIFAVFWHLTTGEWRHYIPTADKLLVMARFYSSGIFRHEPHPFRPSAQNKHNPLQRLTYLAILVLVSPLIWISGWLYLFYAQWAGWGLGALQLSWVATAHTVGAFLMLAFFVTHLYMITTGHTLFAQTKAMLTGWEELH
ncbi:cytochrome b/b6 domain-containing protein [Ideonella sp. A 288]|uniref:cytochrome b/b6 domain-containing protein n=1 Tax=Ideonella sp. A 288 TaxID=1962181 RepID=UPI000B4A6DF2|nr:cytochrome b/b6 domain-containing protein [Ideonella sp. A 288]